jgi:hypothetical protein
MKMMIQKCALAGLCFAVLLNGGITSVSADEEEDAAVIEDSKRSALWRKLMGACPPEHREIQVYATNPELTLVCFRSGRQIFTYSTKTGKVERVVHAKKISPDINRITYHNDGFFRLWYYGRVELRIGAGG